MEEESADERVAAPDLVLAGGGEMGAHMRAFDWSRTPIGPITGWPQSLKTMVSLILGSQQPMWIGWGADITFLYNDAYLHVLGHAKHPWALGQPAHKVWAEIWDVCGPLAENVYRKGESAFVENVRLFLKRGDSLEETYYSFSYSPIRDESGNVGGLFCPSNDVTLQVLSTRRLATIAKLVAAPLEESAAAIQNERAAHAEALHWLPQQDESSRTRNEHTASNVAHRDSEAGNATLASSSLISHAASFTETEQALRASEERFRIVQQNTPDGFMVFESVREGDAIVDFRWAYTNPAAEQIVGRTAQDLAGRRLLEEMPGNRDEGLFDAYVQVVETGEVWQREFSYPHEGLDKWFRTTATRTGDGFAVAFEDVTERKRAEAERERLAAQRQLALDAAQLGWWHYDPVNRVSWWDNQYKAIFGIAESRNPIDEVMARLHPDDVAAVWAAVEAALDPENSAPYAVEYRIRRRDGSIRWIEAYGLPSFEEVSGSRQATSFVGTVADITERKAAEDRLRASEARFRQLAESLPQFVWVTGADGLLEYVNAQWTAYAGLSLEQTNDPAALASRFHPDDAAAVFERWLHARATGAVYEVKGRMRRTDGVYRWFLMRSTPFKDEAGRVTKWFGTSTDIHEQEESGRDAQFLASLAEHIRHAYESEALIAGIAQLTGQYLAVTRCYVAEIDVDADRWQVQGDYYPGLASLSGTYHLSDYSAIVIEAARAGQVQVINDAATDPRTAALYVAAYAPIGINAHIIVPFLRNGQLVSGLVVAADTPRQWQPREVRLLEMVAERGWLAIERLRAEQALREREERLQILYAQEQAARQEAEEANQLKDEFLATVSHELRTPLTAILGYGYLLQSRPRDAAYIERTLAKILSSAKVQAQLIEDLLDVARIMTGKLRLEVQPMDVVAVIHAAIDAVRPAIDGKAIRLVTDLDPAAAAIVGDPARLQQVVWNLLSNAVKFTPAGGLMEVCLHLAGGEVQLSVSDTGQGIAASFLPYVFERFRQADSTSTRAHSGLGLGLSIARRLVELHGGTVQAHSSGTGQGATFTVRLPRSTPRDAAALAEDGLVDVQVADAACPPELAGLRVLVVDDQPAITELLDEVLSACGVVVHTSTAARDALATLQTWRPDVLVSDIAMPGEDGYWLIRQLRALAVEAGGATPALALTAYVRSDERARVLAAGFQQCVPKPVEPAELRAAVALLVSPGALADA